MDELVLGIFYSVPVLAALLAVAIITPSWHYVGGVIATWAVFFLIAWPIISAGRKQIEEHIFITIGYILFGGITIGVLIASGIYLIGVAWWKSNRNPHNAE